MAQALTGALDWCASLKIVIGHAGLCSQWEEKFLKFKLSTNYVAYNAARKTGWAGQQIH